MKFFLNCLLLGVCILCRGEIQLDRNGRLLFDGSGEYLEVDYAGIKWKNFTRINSKNFVAKLSRNKNNTRMYGKWYTKDGVIFDCDLQLSAKSGGKKEYSLDLQTREMVEVAVLAPVILLKTTGQKRVLLLDDKRIVLPETLGARTLLEEKTPREHTLVFQSGKETYTVSGRFAVRIQDNRYYKQQNFSISLIPSENKTFQKFLVKLNIDCVQEKFTLIDLKKSANMGFYDKVPDDGKGGWTDQGPSADLAQISTGKQNVKGVPFEIIVPAENAGRSCLVLCNPEFRSYPPVQPVVCRGKSGAFLYLLHASAWPGKPGSVTGKIEVRYADGSEETIPVKSAVDCGNWWRPTDLDNGQTGMVFQKNNDTFGLYLSCFPLQKKELHSLCFKPGTSAVWMIVGATLANQRVLNVPEKELVITAGKDWAELPTGNTILTNSPLDLSFMLDAPAGKYGRVIAGNDDFVFEKKPSQKIRFNGVNLCNQHLFMPRNTVDAIVDRICKMGYNSVRFHHIDRKILEPKANNSFTFDPRRVDELNYLFAQCKEKGLYITIDLFSMRPLKEGDGVKEFPRSHGGQEMKVLIPLFKGAMDSWKRYARQLLALKNPYTGLTWGEDPALFSLNLINEASLPAQYTRHPHLLKIVRNAWAEDLKSHGMEVPADRGEAQKSLMDYLLRKEAEALDEMIRFVREELRYKGLITNYNYDAWYYQAPLREKLDFVDVHSYLDHPTYPRNKWKLPAYYRQVSSLEEFASEPGRLAGAREMGKPYMISEAQFCNPNIYRSEYGTLWAAVLALQGYNACFRFSYGDTFEFRSPRFFALDNEPVSQLTEKMMSFLFVRGDIASAKTAVAVNWEPREVAALRTLHAAYPADFRKLILYGKVGSLRSGKRIPGVVSLGTEKVWEENLPEDWKKALAAIRNGRPVTSSTGEIVWEPAVRRVKIITPRSEAFSLEKGAVKGDILTVEQVKCFTTISLHARKKISLKESDDMLLFHIPNTAATGMRFSNTSKNLLEDWGKLPLLVQRDKPFVTIKHPLAGKLQVFSLNWDGSVKERIPVSVQGEKLRFCADSGKGVMMYHITIR